MIFILLVLPLTLFAETLHMAVLGGSGEPQTRETTIFDPGLERMGQFNRSHPDIRSQVSFNGGHERTEEIARQGFGSSRPFTAQEYYRIIEDYKRRINSGDIRRGEKLLINLYSHGASQDAGETTHKIAAGSTQVTNFDTMTGTTTVSVDALKSLRDLARAKGVRLGIIDLSCHSGSSLALADENTCVISATGPNHYSGAGTMSFGTLLSGSLAPGKSLEDAYLEARSQFNDPSFPMISSAQGRDVQQRLYENQTPFLYYYNPNNDKLTPYLERIAVKAGECRIDESLLGLNSEIANILQAGASAEVTTRLTAFRSALNEYHSYLRDVKRRMDEFGIGEIGKIHEICSGSVCQKYSVKEIISTSFSAFIPYYEEQGDRARADIARQGEAVKTRLLSENPRLRQSAQFWQGMRDLQSRTSVLQGNISRTQRELYLEMYRQSAAVAPNPCRDFKL